MKLLSFIIDLMLHPTFTACLFLFICDFYSHTCDYSILLQVTDKFLDLSIEKTNSAYMLFYERVRKVRG